MAGAEPSVSTAPGALRAAGRGAVEMTSGTSDRGCRVAPITARQLEKSRRCSDDRSVGSSFRGSFRRVMPLLAVTAIALVAVGATMGAMTIKKLGPRLCETTGGGRFVKIPGFPGEKIDRRLLNDIRFLRERWKIYITDGY